MNRIEQQRAIIAHGFHQLMEERNMPSKTPKQRRTMAAAAHNPAFAKKMGIPQKVAKEFNRADARKGKRK